jgi:para-nitrobenzyl esterase
MSIGGLLGAPGATGLFHRAILQSGASSNAQQPHVAEWVAERFLGVVGLSPASVEGVLDLSVDEVLRAQSVVENEVMRGEAPVVWTSGAVLAFQPTVDGVVMDRQPLDAVRDGSAAGVPLVVGTNAEEWNLFHLKVRQEGPLDEAKARKRLGVAVGERHVSALLDAYRAARPGADVDGLVVAAMTDRVFRMPAIRLAEAQLPHADRVSMYRFDLPSTAFGGLLGACHAVEIPFVLGNLHRRGVDLVLGGVDEGAEDLSRRMVGAWTSMARTGDPEHEGLPWPAYDTDRRATAVLDRTVAVEDDPEGELRALWDEIDTSVVPHA